MASRYLDRRVRSPPFLYSVRLSARERQPSLAPFPVSLVWIESLGSVEQPNVSAIINGRSVQASHRLSSCSLPPTHVPANCYPNSTAATAGTAYPYVAPPPQAVYYNPNPNNPYYARPYPDRRATFLRRLFGIFIASFIIAGTIGFIVWLVLRPRLPEFRVDSVSLSNFNLSSSSSQITGNWDVQFTARNPNHKISLYYDHIDASVSYKSERLSETRMAPFAQGKRNQTAVRATFVAALAYVDKSVVDGITKERTRGNVNFNVRMVARVRFKGSVWRDRRRFLSVYCGDLVVGVSAKNGGGTLTTAPRPCNVGL
ncbi:hypothetical protein NMG60_11015546 [Bertholletia excelsa]